MIIDIVNIDFEMISNISDSLFMKLSFFFVYAKIQFQIIKNDPVLEIIIFPVNVGPFFVICIMNGQMFSCKVWLKTKEDGKILVSKFKMLRPDPSWTVSKSSSNNPAIIQAASPP